MIMSEENTLVKGVEHLGYIEERLRQATDEIDSIKSLFSKSTEDLSRIQNMLDVGKLGEISTIIEKCEGRATEAEKKRDEAFHGAKKYSEELEKEKERLIKLWDAYKNQEEELSAAETKLTSFEERARNAEVTKKQLEDDFSTRITTLTKKLEENEDKVKQFEDYKQRFEEFGNVRNQLEEEIHSLKGKINEKDDTIDSLQKDLVKAKEYEKYAEYKDKFSETSEQYEKEKERLTKLYHLYEETETECNKLRKETKDWQNWFNSNKEIFDKLFSAPPSISTINTKTREKPKEIFQAVQTPDYPTTDHTEKTNNTENHPKPKKRRLRFKK
jgi:chromosome segregation ATPase